MDPIRFSVVTISYNEERNIEPTLQSVCNQSYPHIEYILIDGGSQDRTVEIIGRYRSKIAALVTEKDKGIYDAMNKGLLRASGDYVIFMNAGDCFADESVLSNVVSRIAGSLPEFIYGDYVERDAAQRLFYKKAHSHRRIWYGMFTAHQSMIYKREPIVAHDLHYDLDYKIASDYKLTSEFLRKTRSRVYIRIPFSEITLSGVSRGNQNLGLREASRVRKEVFHHNRLLRLGIVGLCLCARVLSTHLKPIYKVMRGRKEIS